MYMHMHSDDQHLSSDHAKHEDPPAQSRDRSMPSTKISPRRPPLHSRCPYPFTATYPAGTIRNVACQDVSDDLVVGKKIPEMMTWRNHFDESRDINVGGDIFRCYLGGEKSQDQVCDEDETAVVFLHGCGHCALSWALVAGIVKSKCMVLAYDARGHGKSQAKDETNLSAEKQVEDAAAVIREIFKDKDKVPQIVLCGQSMGGAIATRLATTNLLPTLVGLIVIDVVEGTAISALPYMHSWIERRKSSFDSIESAVKYVVEARYVRNYESAVISVPSQLSWNKEKKKFFWRTELRQSEAYWKGWFEGMSRLFLSAPVAKLLILAEIDRLDRELTIAQMQGKFQNLVIASAGHTVQEDRPDETAKAVINYLSHNAFIGGGEGIPKEVRDKIAASRTPRVNN